MDVDRVKKETLAQDNASHKEDMAIDWREIAERRITKLTEAERDLFVVRERLDHFQSSYRLLSQQSEERLLHIRALNRELEEMRAAYLHRRGASRGWLAALRARSKRSILFLMDLVLRVPLVRPILRKMLRIFPKVGNRLRARFRASRQLV